MTDYEEKAVLQQVATQAESCNIMPNVPYRHVFLQLFSKFTHVHRSPFEKSPKTNNSH